MWPRRSTVYTTHNAIEKRPLLATEMVDDGPLVAGCGKTIGVKAESMGYVVVDAPNKTPTPPRQPTALQQWGAVAVALVGAVAGRQRRTSSTPVPDT